MFRSTGPARPAERAAVLAFLLILTALTAHAQDAPRPEPDAKGHSAIWLDAESMPITGSWTTAAYEGRRVLQGVVGKQAVAPKPALAGVRVPRSGEYTLWACSMQHGDRRREFGIDVNGQANQNTLGKSSLKGYIWERAGTFNLAKGAAEIALRDVDCWWVRVDKILLTDDPGYVPKGTGKQQNASLVAPKYTGTYTADNEDWFFGEAQRVQAGQVERDDGLTLRNGTHVLRFGSADVGGKRVYFPLLEDAEGNLLNDPTSGYFVFLFDREQKAKFRPWIDPLTEYPFFETEAKVAFGNHECVRWLKTLNPFISYGTKIYFYPEQVLEQAKASITFLTEHALFSARITYSLEAEYPKVAVSVSSKQAGYITCGGYFFTPVARADASYIHLPMRYYAKHLPPEVLIAPSASMSAPLSMIEKGDGTHALVGNLDDEPFRELSLNQSFAGLAIYNERKQLQPGCFYPVPAADNSRVEAGDSRSFSFYLYAKRKAWNASFFEIASDLLKVSDYRRNYQVTLNEAIYNLTDLVMNDRYGGWVKDHKGWVQIEDKNKVTRAVPLVLYELYHLTGDERIYESRVVPTLEYMFSRAKTHTPTDGTNEKRRTDPRYAMLSPGPMDRMGASIYNGFAAMSQNRNPYLIDDGRTAHEPWKGRSGHFADSLAAYQMTGDATYLRAAENAAQDIIRTEIDQPITKNKHQTFMKPRNTQQYFFAFVDLYETTGKAEYLRAAEVCGDLMCTSIFTHPVGGDEDYLIDEKELLTQAHHLSAVYYGDKRSLRGYDLSAYNDESSAFRYWGIVNPYSYLKDKSVVGKTTVPAWVVSRSGLGIEGIGSLMPRPLRAVENPPYNDLPFRTIANNGECAYLMRLFGHSGRKHYWDYSRNQIIGRFANYTGYYLPLFTTRHMRADYPYKGPDVSLVYYHHIPVHLAFSVDFLITSAIVRSRNQIDFPSVTQRGYAWFVNRMYGHKPGTFFGDTGVYPVLKRGLIELDSIACNYLTACSRENFYVYLMNEQDTPVTVNVMLNAAMFNVKPGAKPKQMSVTLAAKGAEPLTFEGFALKNMPALSTDDVTVQRDSQDALRVEDPTLKTWVQAALIAHPFKDKAHMFIATKLWQDNENVTVHYKIGDDAWQAVTDNLYPYEVTLPIDGLAQPVEFYITRGSSGEETDTYRLQLSTTKR